MPVSSNPAHDGSHGASLKARELRRALRAFRAAFVGIGLISAVVNLLYLTGSFFMLEVYDRVLPSRSVPTLVGLAVIAAALFAIQGLLDIIRGRLLTRVGVGLDEKMNDRVYSIVLEVPLKGSASYDGLQPMRDLDQVRGFLSGAGPLALVDMPWLPLYLIICFAFHFWIGMAALTGAALLIALAILTETLTRAPSREAASLSAQRIGIADSSRRNAEVIRAMGMGRAIAGKWRAVNALYMTKQRQAADVANGLGAISRVMRTLLQSAVLGVGAYLVIEQQTTAGIIIASSILTARALAPVELAIGNWRGFFAARQSWARLHELLRRFPEAESPVELAKPFQNVTVEGVTVVPPAGRLPVLQDISFRLNAGQALGVIGPSGSGKSTLARSIVGVWPPVRGKVRIDGAALDQWTSERLGAHIGYLPQDIELFDGTVAQNIARFMPDAAAEAIVEAATAASLHDLILRMPNGYDTQIGQSGAVLSAGQRQRLGLARALYGKPFLLVLDEPNSNLDQDGDLALNRAIAGVRIRGGIVIVIAHRPGVIAYVDQLLVLAEGGRMAALGPKDQVLASLATPRTAMSEKPMKMTAGAAAK